MVLAASSLIAACSGGGGGSSTPASVSNASVSGSVSQGSAGAASIRKQAVANPISGAKITIKSYDTAGNLYQTVETVSSATGDFIAQVAALTGGGWISIKAEKDNAIAFEKTFPYKTAAELSAGLNIQAQLDPIVAKVVPVYSGDMGAAAAGDMVSIAIVQNSNGAKKIVSNSEITAAKAAGGTITWQLDVAKQILAAAGTTSLTVKAQNYNPADPDDMTRFPADNADTGERLVSASFDFIDIKDQDGKALTIPKATAKEIRKSALVAYKVKKQIPNCDLVVKDEDTTKAGVQIGFYFMRNGKWTKLGMATLYKNSTPDDTQLFQLSDVTACTALPYAVLTDADISKDIDFDLKWFNFDYVAFGDIKTACVAGDFKLTKGGVDEALGGVSVYLSNLEQPTGTAVRGFRSSSGYSKNDGKYQIDFTYNNSTFTLSNPVATLSYNDPVTFQYTTFNQTLSAKNTDGCYIIDTRKTTAPECTVTGKVLKSDNTPAVSRSVSTYQAGTYGGSRWDYTDSTGSFSIPAICSVDYKLAVDGITKDFNVNGTAGTDENTDAANIVTMKNIVKANQAPSAYIYADNTSVATGNGVNLSGYGWDPDGDTVTYAWSATCGEFFDTTTQTTGTATSSKQLLRWKAPATAPTGNTCTITLRTSDGSLNGTATTDIFVSSTGNRPPVITYLYAPRAARVNSDNNLSVYAYDANSDTLTYTWAADCGTITPNATTPNLAAWKAPAAAPAGGTCTVTATVTDGIDPVSKSAVIDIAANKPPIIYNMMVPTTAPFGQARTFSGYAYDPDFDQITYNWSATCGSFTNATTSTPTWTAPSTPDTACNITLAVSDGTNNVSQTKTVTTTSNSAPVITSATGPTSASVNSNAQVTGTATDADGDTLSWVWTIKAGSGVLTGTCSGSGRSPVTGTCIYATPSADEKATLTFSVSDGIATTVTQDVGFNVTSVTGGFGVTVQ